MPPGLSVWSSISDSVGNSTRIAFVVDAPSITADPVGVRARPGAERDSLSPRRAAPVGLAADAARTVF